MTRYTADDLVLCQSRDGWSFHAPGATDDDIAYGAAPYITSGPGRPSKRDREQAFRKWKADFHVSRRKAVPRKSEVLK